MAIIYWTKLTFVHIPIVSEITSAHTMHAILKQISVVEHTATTVFINILFKWLEYRIEIGKKPV